MSVLFWAFLAGAATIAFPLVFHLIRRTPKGQQPFSSLMFLQASPPRLTRRSRLDDLLLLLLRALAIVLLVAAFMRPYWRAAADLSLDEVRGRRVVLLLDTSASMRRDGLWAEAVKRAEQKLSELSPADDVALLTFDREVSTLVGFEEQPQADYSRKRALVREQLKQVGPTWHATRLGDALVRAAESLVELAADNELDQALQIFLIGDLQSGSDLAALQVFQWPDAVRVGVEQVSPADSTNALVQLLEPSADDPPSADPRVRVTNASDSAVDQFHVRWQGERAGAGGEPIAFYVPPGQSRVLPAPRGGGGQAADRLVLSGDAASFDNTHYVVPQRQQLVRIAYLGDDDRNDPESMRFYLERAFDETPARKVEFTAYGPQQTLALLEGELPQLIVVTGGLPAEQQTSLESYLTAGGRALLVVGRDSIDSLGVVLPGVSLDEQAAPADENDYRMLGQIDFTHPLFAAFANPRYNDFTGIRFWSYCPVTLLAGDGEQSAEQEPPRVIAHFDNGRPALWEQRRGEGVCYALAAAWHPSASQLALSNKFVPLLEGLLELSLERPLAQASYTVGDSIALPADSADGRRSMLLPSGAERLIASDAVAFDDTSEPGIYTFKTGGSEQTLAVNLARGESDTTPLEADRLEQLGVKLGLQATRDQEYERLRQLRDVELENRQKLWKWLIVAALAMVAWETGLAGWRAQRSVADRGESR